MIISTIDNKEAKKEKPFPKLMIGDNSCVVLFIKPRQGTVVFVGCANTTIGYQSNCFALKTLKTSTVQLH